MTLTVTQSSLLLSHSVPGLEQHLTLHSGEREEGSSRILCAPTSYLKTDGESISTPRTLLHRVRRFLDKAAIEFEVIWEANAPTAAVLNDVVLQGLQPAEAQLVRAMLESQVGGIGALPEPLMPQVVREQNRSDEMTEYNRGSRRNTPPVESDPTFDRSLEARRQRLITALATAHRGQRGLIIVKSCSFARSLRETLIISLGQSIGLVAGNEVDDEEIVLTTAAAFARDTIPYGYQDFVIVDEVPRKQESTMMKMLPEEFPDALKYGFIGAETRGRDKKFLAELVFGPTSTLEWAPSDYTAIAHQ